jgi:hypothetical protein
MLTNKKFWNYALERALKTAAQTAVAVLGAGMTNLLQTDWQGLLGVVAGATVLSLLTSISNYKE